MLAIQFGNIMTPVFGASYERMYLLQVVIPLFVDATICFFWAKSDRNSLVQMLSSRKDSRLPLAVAY